MERYARSHLANQTLLCHLTTHLGQERGSTAEFLADLAEVDVRRLYVPRGTRRCTSTASARCI